MRCTRNTEVAQHFFSEVNRQEKKFMSDEHFTVDGALMKRSSEHDRCGFSPFGSRASDMAEVIQLMEFTRPSLSVAT